MPHRIIKIAAGAVSVTAALNDSPTADALWDALPVSASASVWGDEIYFGVPVRDDEREAVPVVELGDVAFWPPGRAVCLFFGPTPISADGEIRPASPVNVIGRIEGDDFVAPLKSVRAGAVVSVEKA